ncbi:unnamed protein product [Orchesella dallaii]|uniref:Uncharacterized protein n=1 Tax=Orchesella dallaii TaxID=48710 RepID=A0ABP1R3K9_9HEXA
MSGSKDNTKMQKESHPRKSKKELELELKKEKLTRECEKMERRIVRSYKRRVITAIEQHDLLMEEINACKEQQKEVDKQLEKSLNELMQDYSVLLKDLREQKMKILKELEIFRRLNE